MLKEGEEAAELLLATLGWNDCEHVKKSSSRSSRSSSSSSSSSSSLYRSYTRSVPVCIDVLQKRVR